MKKVYLFNKTKNCMVSDNVFLTESFFERLKGLLGKKQLDDNEALIITKCNSIHTLFMKFAIDVVFINNSYQVIDICKNVGPWRLLLPRFKSHQTIEFKSGFINNDNMATGDQLDVSS